MATDESKALIVRRMEAIDADGARPQLGGLIQRRAANGPQTNHQHIRNLGHTRHHRARNCASSRAVRFLASCCHVGVKCTRIPIQNKIADYRFPQGSGAVFHAASVCRCSGVTGPHALPNSTSTM